MATFKIASQFDGKVLDVPGFATGNGAVIQQFQDNGGVNQHWQLILANDDGITYKIVSQGTRKVLDVPGFATGNGVQIQQFDDNGGTNQHWQLIRVD